MKIGILAVILSVAFASAMLFSSPNVSAAKTAADCQKSSFFGIPSWYQYLEFDDKCEIKTDAGNTVILILFAVLDIILYLAGFVAAFYIIYGGFQFILAQGSPERVTSARQTILNAVIGIIITIVAAQVVGFIAKRIGGL